MLSDDELAARRKLTQERAGQMDGDVTAKPGKRPYNPRHHPNTDTTAQRARSALSRRNNAEQVIAILKRYV